MKALILCAGLGSRLRPVTHTGAKHLIPVANKPILYYAIEAVVACGITEIGLILSRATQAQLQAAVGDGDRFGASISYWVQEEPLGLAHAVGVGRDFVGDSDFLVYLGDNLIREGIVGFVDSFRANNGAARILVAPVPDPRRFGVAIVESGHVARVVEKPREPVSNLAIVGVYAFQPSIFEAIDKIEPSARGELEITDAIQWLVEHGHPVSAHELTDWWADTGKLEDLLDVNRRLLEELEPVVSGSVDEASQVAGRVSIGEGTEVRNSVLRGPVAVGPNCLIEDCYVGPYTSIAEGCKLVRTEIEYSILLPEAQVSDMPARVDQSLLGTRVILDRQTQPPHTLRFFLGDESHVTVM